MTNSTYPMRRTYDRLVTTCWTVISCACKRLLVFSELIVDRGMTFPAQGNILVNDVAPADMTIVSMPARIGFDRCRDEFIEQSASIWFVVLSTV